MSSISSARDPSSDSNPPSRSDRPDSSDSNRPAVRAKPPSVSPIMGVSLPDLSAPARSPTASLASDTYPSTSPTELARSRAASDPPPNRVSISSPDTDDGSKARIRSDALASDAELSPRAFSSESRARTRSSASPTPG